MRIGCFAAFELPEQEHSAIRRTTQEKFTQVSNSSLPPAVMPSPCHWLLGLVMVLSTAPMAGPEQFFSVSNKSLGGESLAEMLVSTVHL
jgi:hypothetical protein